MDATTTSTVFGRKGAGNYDFDAESMPDRYSTSHRIQNEIVLAHVRSEYDVWPAILDLGCGTAIDGVSLSKYASQVRYIGIDKSKSMLDVARNKMRWSPGFDQVKLHLGDLHFYTRHEKLQSIVSASFCTHIGAVIAAYVFHHYDRLYKETIFRRILELLPSGGVFVLTDLFSNQNAFCSDLCLEQEIQDIQRSARHQKNRNSESIEFSTWTEDHYRHVNKPASLSEEIDLLRGAGFHSVDVVYREAQVAVVAAEKSQ